MISFIVFRSDSMLFAMQNKNEKNPMDILRRKFHWIVMSIGALAYAVSAQFSLQYVFLKWFLVFAVTLIVGFVGAMVWLTIRGKIKNR